MAEGKNLLVGRACLSRGRRQIVQLLKLGIAQHEAILGIPQHERFRDRLDRVPQPDVGGGGALGEALLFRHVHRDADEMRPGIGILADDFGARAQPDPVTARVAHAERAVDRAVVSFGEQRRDVVKAAVVGMHEAVHLAERQKLLARLEPQNLEHRLRPVDAPAREIPVPTARTARD